MSGLGFSRLHQARDRGADPVPSLLFGGQMFPAGRCQAVIFRTLIVLRLPPLGLDPTLALEAMQRRIQRAGLNLEDVARPRPDGLGDAVAVLRSPAQRLQDQHVQSPLDMLRSEEHTSELPS